MTDKNFVFRAYPHSARISTLEELKSQRATPTRKHYESLFLGKPVSDVQAACEQELVRKHKHDVVQLDCEQISENTLEVYYVYYGESTTSPMRFNQRRRVYVRFDPETGIINDITVNSGREGF